MKTIRIASQLLVNQYPSSYLFKTKHIGGSLFKIMKANVTAVKVVALADGLGHTDFHELTITPAQYESIETFLNRISINKYELIK